MSLQITNNTNKAQETFLKQLEGLALARDILTAKNLNNKANCGMIASKSTCESSMNKRVILPNEAIQILSNLEALKEAGVRYFQRNSGKTLPSNITTVPKFHEEKQESIELSDSAKETFARISSRAKLAFIKEQLERAMIYNIDHESYGDDYYKLMQDIDKYEYLLEKAQKLGIYWDISEYDPIALEQEIEEADHAAYTERMDVRFYFSSTRGVEV